MEVTFDKQGPPKVSAQQVRRNKLAFDHRRVGELGPNQLRGTVFDADHRSSVQAIPWATQ